MAPDCFGELLRGISPRISFFNDAANVSRETRERFNTAHRKRGQTEEVEAREKEKEEKKRKTEKKRRFVSRSAA